jgi:hypothetical protein
VKHFLVERDRIGLRKITVYEDGGEAYEAFTERERELYPWRTGFSTSQHPEVVLLGADSLSACIATHSSWFDESADPMDLFQPALSSHEGRDDA